MDNPSPAPTTAELIAHTDNCTVCSKANRRANDFCDAGKVLFYDWARTQKPEGVEVLSEEQSQQIIAEAEKKREQANKN